MEKKALLVKGTPKKKEKQEDFDRWNNEKLSLMEEIALNQGYSVQESDWSSLPDVIQSGGNPDYFLLYYTGHAGRGNIGSLKHPSNYFMDLLKDFTGRKIIVLDACVGDNGDRNISELHLYPNSLLLTSDKVYEHRNLARLLWDYVFAYKQPIESIDRNTFKERGHSWVEVRERKK